LSTVQPTNDSGIWRRNLDGWARALFEGIDDAIFVHDLQGRILDANPAACRKLGYSRDEMLLLNTRDIDDPDFAQGFVGRWERQMEKGHLRCEGRHRTKDGRVLLVDINTSAIEFNGKPCVLAVMRDITEQKRIEKSLRESEAFYHSLVETLPQNLYRKDRLGRITFANQRYCNLLGVTLEELIGKTDFDLFPEALARKYIGDDRRVLDSGKPLELVEEHCPPEGGKLYVQVIKTPILDANGKIIGTQGLFWDVTERVAAEQAVAASERRYRQLTEATLDAIILADCRGNITLFNPAAEKLFGYRAEDILGQPVAVLMPFAYLERHQRGLQRFVETRVPHIIGRPVEVHGRREDGTEFPLEIVLTAINADSELTENVQFLGAIRDLTERNRMRSVLVQNEKLASIGLLSAGVAHEINNPLAFIGNNLAVLERDLLGVMEVLNLYESARGRLEQVDKDTVARVRELSDDMDLDYIRENLFRLIGRTREGVDRVAKIVQSLRGLARTGKPQRQKAIIPDLVDSSLEMLRNRLKRQNIRVETSYNPEPTLWCVPTQISQVLLNLLLNATQAIEAAEAASPTRAGSGVIRITVERQEFEMLVAISDNGAGIPPENLPHIFDPFFTTKDVGEGTGLGLSITHNIIAGHGGRTEVDSTVGQGTTFRVFLPLTDA
jgi:PAS domain S-box-containing protein